MSLGSAAHQYRSIGRVFRLAKSKQPPVTPIQVDIQSSINLAKNDISGNCFKHINMKCHLLRQLLSKNKFQLTYCPRSDMIATFLQSLFSISNSADFAWPWNLEKLMRSRGNVRTLMAEWDLSSISSKSKEIFSMSCFSDDWNYRSSFAKSRKWQ